MLATQSISNNLSAPHSYRDMSLSGKHLDVARDATSSSISRRSSTSSTHGETDSQHTKPKITKSRNGCITCKAKRLKCDETKPTCLQCKKRKVECGGYRKNFKWKSFDETSFGGEGSSKARDAQTSTENNLFAPSPGSGSPSSPTSQASAIPDPISISQSGVPSLQVPQTPLGFSPSSQFSYYDPSGEQEYVEMPSLLDQPYQPEHPGGHGALRAYPPFGDEADFDLTSAEMDAMMAHEMQTSVTQAAFYPSVVSTSYGDVDRQAIPSMTLNFQPPPPLNVRISQTPTHVYDQQQIISPSMPAQHIAQHMEWPLEGSGQIEPDEQALQQAMSNLIAQQQEEARRRISGPANPRSRSFS